MNPYVTSDNVARMISDDFLLQDDSLHSFVNIISCLEEPGVLNGSAYNAFEGLINYTNFSAKQINVAINSGSAITNGIAKTFSLYADNLVYDGSRGWNTVIEALNMLNDQTISSVIGTPWLNFIMDRGASTLADALSHGWDFETSEVSGDLMVTINGTSTNLCKFSIDKESKQVLIYSINPQAAGVISEVMKISSYLLQTNEIFQLASQVGSQTISGLSAAISKFNDSRWSDVRDLVRNITSCSLRGPNAVTAFLCSKYKNQYDFTINDDGTITWGEEEVRTTDYTPWRVFWSSIGSIVSTAGTVLLYTSAWIGKVIGAVAMIGGAAITTFMSLGSGLAGTVPTVAIDAQEPVYADYMFYQHYHVAINDNNETRDVSEMFNQWNTMQCLEVILGSRYFETLRSSGGLVINTPLWVIYIFNYNSDGSYEDYDVKIFPTVCCGALHYVSPGSTSIGKVINPWNMNDFLPSGWHVDEYGQIIELSADNPQLLFYGPILCKDGSNLPEIAGLDSVGGFLKYVCQDVTSVQPSDLISPSNSYEDWDVLGGALSSSIAAIYMVAGCAGGFSSNDSPFKSPQWWSALVDLDYTGSIFSGKVSDHISIFRNYANWRVFPALLLCTEGCYNSEVYVYSRYIRPGSTTISRTRHYVIPQIPSAVYSFNYANVKPMVVPPARSLSAVVAAAALTAAAIIATTSAIKIASKGLTSWKSEKRQQKIRSFQDEMKHFDFKKEEFKQLSRADQIEYKQAYQKATARIRRFNLFGKLFGLTTYDVRNDWVEVPDTSEASLRDGTSAMFASIEDILKEADVINSESSTDDIIGSSIVRPLNEVSADNVSLVDIYRAIRKISS